jgi:hypothetical protein
MFTAGNVFGILRFLLRLFARRKAKGTAASEIVAAPALTSTPRRSEAMSAGFDAQTEIAKLAHRIVEPVAAKLPVQELEPVVGQIRHAFEQLNPKRTAADTDFQSMAVDIMKPVRPMLNEAEFTRIVDRLEGAMAAFCQKSDWSQTAA